MAGYFPALLGFFFFGFALRGCGGAFKIRRSASSKETGVCSGLGGFAVILFALVMLMPRVEADAMFVWPAIKTERGFSIFIEHVIIAEMPINKQGGCPRFGLFKCLRGYCEGSIKSLPWEYRGTAYWGARNKVLVSEIVWQPRSAVHTFPIDIPGNIVSWSLPAVCDAYGASRFAIFNPEPSNSYYKPAVALSPCYAQ